MYYPNGKAGAFHLIEVKVARSGTRVRTRHGFGQMEPDVAIGPSGKSAACEREVLRPYPYESKVTSANGCTVYHDDLQSEASGWPVKDRYHYAAGGYEIVNRKHGVPEHTNLYTFTGHVPVADVGSTDPAEGVLAANGPWFGDMNASVSVELTSTGGAGDLAAAGGLVFHLNDRGYYAVIIGKSAAGSRKIVFKLIKKFHFETTARDLLPWTEFPLSDLTAEPRKTISVQCKGVVITILLEGHPVAKFEDHDFQEGLTGMILYGTGRAVFRDLLVEEACARPL